MRLPLCVIGLLLPASAAAQPVISAVLNAASFDPGAAPGSIISIFGAGLASQTLQAANVPLPNTLGGTSVTVTGQGAIPLYSVSPTQINAVVPFLMPVYSVGQPIPTIVVRTSDGASQAFDLEVRPAVPGLFTTAGNGQGQALIFDPGFSAVTQLLPGNTYIVYATGLGAVQPVPLPGDAGATAPPFNTVTAPVQVVAGETAITPTFTAIAPGLVGVYQINFTVPLTFIPATDRIFIRSQGWQSNVASFQVPPSNVVAQGTIQALYPYTLPGGGMMPPVSFGVLLEAGVFTVQITVPPLSAASVAGQHVRIAAVTDAGSTVVGVDNGSACYAEQTAVTPLEQAGNFSFLGLNTPILSFPAIQGLGTPYLPGSIVPHSVIDPVWLNAVSDLPQINTVTPPNLTGNLQSSCSIDSSGVFSVNSTTNVLLSSFGGLRMLPYAPSLTRTSTFKLYVNGIVIAQQQVQFSTGN